MVRDVYLSRFLNIRFPSVTEADVYTVLFVNVWPAVITAEPPRAADRSCFSCKFYY